MAVKKGDKVKVEYEGKLEDGTVFDSSAKHGHPLAFTVGEGQVIPGFENAVIGLEKDGEKEVTIKPEDGYGSPNDKLLKKIPRDQLPSEPEPKAGMTLGVTLPTGQQLPAKIISVEEKEITIDLNHPLAGKVLKFKVKVVEIEG